MSNTNFGLLIGSGVATIGAVLIYTVRKRNRNRSRLARTRKQAAILKRQAARIGEAAADAFETGKVAYRQVVNQVAERVAG